MSKTMTYREKQTRDHMRLQDALAAAKADPARALRNFKARHRTRQRNMLDPQWDNNRRFPEAGLSTADYIAEYQRLNGHTRPGGGTRHLGFHTERVEVSNG